MEQKLSIVFLVWLTSSSAVTSARVSSCPAYCTCANSTLRCNNGYFLDTITLRLLPTNFTTVEVDNFVIRKLTSYHFRWFTELRHLTIMDSRIGVIDEDSLSQLPQLESVDLQSNHIANLSAGLFTSQRNLTSLYLGNNLIEHLPETIFQHNTLLHTLVLSSNRLRLLPSKVFDGLSNLVHLDLSHNEISYVLPRTFSFLSVVRYIDLSDNLLVTIHPDLFDSNNVTLETKLSVSANPFECNCGLVWLREALLGRIGHLEVLDSSEVVCANPRKYHGRRLDSGVELEHLNCTSPTVEMTVFTNHIHNTKVCSCVTVTRPTAVVEFIAQLLLDFCYLKS